MCADLQVTTEGYESSVLMDVAQEADSESYRSKLSNQGGSSERAVVAEADKHPGQQPGIHQAGAADAATIGKQTVRKMPNDGAGAQVSLH
jgi:hypothetical protein